MQELVGGNTILVFIEPQALYRLQNFAFKGVYEILLSKVEGL